ncbi:RsmE family RNA methyltransferase [Leptotrichia sp. HSP-536]|uniref:Ribosomal RNA small subunit methyltransferase E n=1 Tax=Leptotrichia alba TaxID=3239304 RepID=A0AB39V5I0_9FUSO
MLTVIAEKENIDENNGKILIKEKSDCNHIQNVYRLNVGDKLRIVDGEYEYFTQIIEISKKEVVVKILEKNEDSYSLNINIDVAIGILKNDKMNLAIQKLTEIGVKSIIPLKTERVVVRINEKKEKWDTVARETLKQCRGVKFTEILPVKKLTEIDYKKYDKIIFAYENSNESKSLSEIIKQEDKNILYIIGPEGGITQEEVDFLKNNKSIEISLGKRILRAETAAIVVCGIIANFYM